MAKTRTSNVANLRSKKTAKQKEHLHISLTKSNYYIIGLGILVIIIGYFLMSENSVDGFLPTVVAPIFLFIGYCIIVPFGILYKPKDEVSVTDTDERRVVEDTEIKGAPNVKTSNVKTS